MEGRFGTTVHVSKDSKANGYNGRSHFLICVPGALINAGYQDFYYAVAYCRSVAIYHGYCSPQEDGNHFVGQAVDVSTFTNADCCGEYVPAVLSVFGGLIDSSVNGVRVAHAFVGVRASAVSDAHANGGRITRAYQIASVVIRIFRRGVSI